MKSERQLSRGFKAVKRGQSLRLDAILQNSSNLGRRVKAIPGLVWKGNPICLSLASIVAFARDFDPQDMHSDENSEAAEAFGGVIASGWHVAALIMRDLVETSPFGAHQMLGMGVEDLRWLKPVRPDDTLVAERSIEEIRSSRSRPDRRIVRMTTTVRNQRDEEVMRFVTAIQLQQDRETD